MEEKTRRTKLVFFFEFNDRAADEAKSRGCLTHVGIQVDKGPIYAVSFYDPVRLQQDLMEYAKWNRAYLAEAGMIVVPDVTTPYMEAAAEGLFRDGFFGHFRPMVLNPTGKYEEWPPPRSD